MLDVESEEKQAFTKVNKLNAYLIELSAERARLLSGTLGDPVETIIRIAEIDTQLVVAKEVSQAYLLRYEELKRRQVGFKGPRNRLFGIAQRG